MLDPDGELGGGKAGGLRSNKYTEAFLFCCVLDRFRRVFEAPDDKRMSLVEKNGLRCLSFYIRAAFFEDWLKRHSDSIGAKFTFRDNPRPIPPTSKNAALKPKRTGQGRLLADTAVIARASSTRTRTMSGVERGTSPECDCRRSNAGAVRTSILLLGRDR